MPTIHGSSTNMYHKSDFTGDVVLNVERDAVAVAEPGRMAVAVNFDDLRTLIMDYLRQKMIENINNMEDDEFEKFLVFGETKEVFELPTLGVSDQRRILNYDPSSYPSK